VKDTEARQRIEALETALAQLPLVLTEAVLANLQPFMTRTNGLVDRFNGEIDVLKALVEKVESAGVGQEVIALELNHARVDLNGLREIVVAISDSNHQLEQRFDRLKLAAAAMLDRA